MPDDRTLVDATQGGVSRHIRLATHQTRSCLADPMRILDVPEHPIGAKFDGEPANRRVIAPDGVRGHESTMGPRGMLYANTVDTCGAVAADRNWDRLSGAVRRCDFRPAQTEDFPCYSREDL